MFRQIGNVRDRLWLLAHDDTGGDLRLRIDVRALSMGLVAAVVTDLLLEDRVRIQRGQIYLTRQRIPPPADPITVDIRRSIEQQCAPPVADVLRAARADLPDDGSNPYLRLYERTLGALVAGGVLLEQRRFMRGTRYLMADTELIGRIRGHINYRMVQAERAAEPALDCLCALVHALNLHSQLPMPYSTGEASDILAEITRRIPELAGQHSPLTVMPQLAQLVAHSVGDLATAPF